MLARLLPLTLLLALLCAGTSQAATVKLPVPAEGQVAVAVASVPKGKKVTLRVGTAPAAVAVSGATRRGRLAIAVVRPRGTFGAGSVSVKVRGGKAKGVRRISAALAGGSAPRAACKTLGRLLGKPLQRAGLAATDLRTVGAAVGAQLCGRPAPAGAEEALARLGLGSGPGGGALEPGGGGGGGGGHAPPPPPTGPGNQCSNGIDDDHDGQIDALSEDTLRPDPGCMNANDPTEAGETPVSAACAASSGAAIGDESSRLNVSINDGCGSFVEAAVYAAPRAFVCDIQASAGAWVCVIDHGQAYAETRNATAADMADLQISVNGDVNCAVPATIVLYRSDFTVAELVEPVDGCGVPKPACANGKDDDGDGLADARETGEDPDPGCSGAADTTESSEVALPAGCVVELSVFNGDDLFPGVVARGCGSVKGAWFKPTAEPTDCFYGIGDGNAVACEVTGRTAGATFAATTQEVKLAMHTPVFPPCGPVTTAITLADGTVVKVRDNWC